MVWFHLNSVAIFAGMSLLCGCSGGRPEARTIGQAGKLTLYEGLPHQFYEAKALEAEREAKPTIELDGFPFYRETLTLKSEDEATLKTILGDSRSFEPYSGEKKCGGFHPDYAVEWSADGKRYVCLICFGCGEFKLFGPAGGASYDIARETRERLKNLLSSYQRNRPPKDTTPP